jgi:hypothetical protein
MRPRSRAVLFSVFVTIIVWPFILSGCSAGSSGGENQAFHLAPLSGMPPEVHAAPAAVQEAYRFAAANSEVLEQLPCYCGCGPIGHTSNYACYISEEKSDGELVFDNHALGCSICVDITQDAMRLLSQGKTVPEIRVYVDDSYSQFGPTNMP